MQLPADLPTNWESGQIISPNGLEAGLSIQHGYNYLCTQVNGAQQTVNTLTEQMVGKAERDHAVFLNSISMGRQSTAQADSNSNGQNSIALGSECVASGQASCAIGTQVTTHGQAAFAGGCGCYITPEMMGGIALGNGCIAGGKKGLFYITATDVQTCTLTVSADWAGYEAESLALLQVGDTVYLFTGSDAPTVTTLAAVDTENAILTTETAWDIEQTVLYVLCPRLCGEESCTAISIGKNAVANGDGALAEGYAALAGGKGAHAEGYLTKAQGTACHAEGAYTTAMAQGAHAEGRETLANNDSCHAEGVRGKAYTVGAHAEGISTQAGMDDNSAGLAAHAEGNATKALGQCAHAEGNGSSAYDTSHAEGYQTVALGTASHAEGWATRAEGARSHAEGYGSKALGNFSHAEGNATTAQDTCHAEGYQTQANSSCSHAEGWLTVAAGTYSHAEGYNTIANAMQHVSGRFNISKPGPNLTANGSTSFLVIGNGTSDTARSNCFRVQSNGAIYSTGAYNTSGADYAEMFEWLDGNTQNEDRRGRFVTLDGEKIRIATAQDDFILGIVSAAPAVIGNQYADNWQGLYERDIFGAPVWEQAGDTKQMKPNPAYDSTKIYIPREERPEWGVVGWIGQLVAVDDGTCQVNGYAQVTDEGIATKSGSRTDYRVLARKDDTHVLLLLK